MVLPILLDVLAPILILMGLGALMRWRFKIDLATLSKLNIYLLVPAFVFDKVSTSTLSWAEMGGVVTITVLQVATLGLLVWGGGRLLNISRKTLAAVAMAVLFYNSGNFGLPLAELAYPEKSAELKVLSAEENAASTQHSALSTRHSEKDGGAVQAFVLMTQNVLTFTVGLTIAAFAHTGEFRKSIANILRVPVLPILAASLAARWWLNGDPSRELPIFISKTAHYLSNGLVPIALVTLGAQLASNPRWPRWKPVSAVIALRLLFGPVQMAALLFGFHRLGWRAVDLWPWPAELLILTAATPTAVNTMLLTLELGGDADLAADCVFWTTVCSSLTIVMWLVILRTSFG